MAFGSGRGGAPGTFIYEGAIATEGGRSSFSTVYMLVDVPDTTSITTFPYNRPIAVSSLAEYENLLGTLPTVGGPELTSYYEVKAFFQQAAVADLRVTRVGTPSTITSLAFSPTAQKDNGTSAPSALAKGDVVYLKFKLNGVEVGERTVSDAWLGVPVTIPVNYVPGDTANNLFISQAMMNAAKLAIEANADLSAGVYIRETGSGSPETCDECSYIYLTGRVYNTGVEVVDSTAITGNQFIFASTAYIITGVTESAQSVYDWIQCVRTAFEDPNLPQGYMIAPAAFTEFKQAGRVNLGQSMEEVCSDSNHKWMAMVDCGPYYVTDIKAYSEKTEMDPADGFTQNQEYLIDNVIYQWTDSNKSFTSANYDEVNPAQSTNSSLSDGAQRALKDDRYLFANTAVSPSTEVITLSADVDPKVLSGELIEIALAAVTPAPIAPTYADTFTSVTNGDLVGTFFIIGRDVDSSLDKNQIRVATSKMRALANQSVNILTGGTPQGGAMLTLRYANAAWEFEVEIKNKVSNLIEVNNANGASFNASHFPATLQKKTTEFDFKALVRQITKASTSIFKGGVSGRYFNALNVSTTADTIAVAAHGYSTSDELVFYTVPSATAPAGLTSGTTYYVIKVNDNTISLAASVSDAEAGTAITLSSAGVDSATVKEPLGAAALGLLTTGGDAVFFSADHGLDSADKVRWDLGITSLGIKGSDKDGSTEYYVKRVDRNLFMLTETASNLAAEVYIDYPLAGVTETTTHRFYEALETAPNAGTFSNAGLLRFTRGRKYQMDVTLAVFNVKDEAGVGIQNGVNDPYGVAYTADLSTDLRLSYSANPVGIAEYTVAAAGMDATTNVIAITDHGYSTGTAVRIAGSAGATLPTGLVDGQTYFAIAVDSSNIKLATTLANSAAGTAVALGTVGVDGPLGYVLKVTQATSPYTYTFTEDESAEPLNNSRDFAGDNNFYCTPLSEGTQGSAQRQVYGLTVLQEGTTYTTMYGSNVEIEFVEPSSEVPDSLWNFNAVTGADLISEALRGVNNNGTPQAVVIETGMDSHSRLFAESQKYSTTQGFLAYYAPYILNDVGVYIPPTAFVTGLAMRRYRDEIGGFRLPPAGAKYSLAGARGVQVEITSGMQDVSNPYGLNALRQLPGYSSTDPDTGDTYGPVFVWGSRTRINPRNAEQALYKFVNTRVILNVIYGSLRNALDGQIFNVIDGRAVTFNQVRTLCSNVLYSQFYVTGALFGSSAADAFDVVVDDRNNPPASLDNGLVNVQIFVVPVPTLERIEIDLLRVSIGGIKQAQIDLGYQ